MASAVIFVWHHVFGAVSGPAIAVGSALKLLGFQVNYVNVRKSEAIQEAQNSGLTECDIAIAMGAPALSVRVEDSWLFEKFGKVFYLWCLDSIFYDLINVRGCRHFFQQSVSSSRLRVISPDLDLSNMINKFSPDTGCYVPFGGFFHPLPEAENERLRRIVVVGTIGSELFPLPDGASLLDLVQDAPAQITPNLHQKFAQRIERPGASLNVATIARELFGLSPETLFSHDVARYLSRIDSYQKRRRRVMALQALKDYPIDIYGTGWEKFAVNFRDCRFRGTVAHGEIGALCQQYAVLLNFDPNWDHGLHDRVYTATGNGCQVLTNHSAALNDLKLPSPDSLSAYDANNPIIGHLAERALSVPPSPHDRLLQFRSENSWFTRLDRLLAYRLP